MHNRRSIKWSWYQMLNSVVKPHTNAQNLYKQAHPGQVGLALSMFFLSLLTLSCGSSDEPEPINTFTGNVFLRSQSEIQSFVNRGITHIDGDLYIGSQPRPGGISFSNIDNLQGLSLLEEVQGSVTIFATTELPSLQGLHNLKTIQGGLTIAYNRQLPDLNSLTSLESISGSLEIFSNGALQDLNGLDGLSGVSSLDVRGERLIESLFDMSNNPMIEGLIINQNAALTDLGGLSGINHVSEILSIKGNTQLTDFCPINHLINSLGSTGSFDVGSNAFNPTIEDFDAGRCSN